MPSRRQIRLRGSKGNRWREGGSRTASEPQKGGPEYSGPPFVRQRVDRGAELLRLSEVDGDGLAVVPPTR